MLKAEGREWAKAWSGSLGCSLGGVVGAGSRVAHSRRLGLAGGREGGGWGNQGQGTSEVQVGSEGQSPQPCPGAGLRSPVCNLARDCRLLSTCCGEASRIMMAISQNQALRN